MKNLKFATQMIMLLLTVITVVWALSSFTGKLAHQINNQIELNECLVDCRIRNAKSYEKKKKKVQCRKYCGLYNGMNK